MSRKLEWKWRNGGIESSTSMWNAEVFFFNNNKFIFDDIYIVKRDTCPCGPPVRMGKVEKWRKVDETTASNFLLSSDIWGKWREKWKGLLLATQPHQYPGTGTAT